MRLSTNGKSPILAHHPSPNQKFRQPKTSEPGFRATLTRNKKHRPFQFLNRRNSVSLGDVPATSDDTILSSNHQQSEFLKNRSMGQKNKSQSQKKPGIFETKKQTFKEFIQKIQMYNKSKLVAEFQPPSSAPDEPNLLNLNNTQICLPVNKGRPTVSNQLSLEMFQKPSKNHNSLHHYVENSKFQLTNQETLHKIGIKYKDKSKKFVVHQSPTRALQTQGYQRPKTEQDIKLDLKLDKKNAKQGEVKDPQKRKNQSTDFTKFYVTNSKKPLLHVSLKLMQCKLPEPKPHPEPKLKTVDSSKGQTRLKDKNSDKPKRLLETKYSKIRIRFGSSIYNKNLWRSDSKSKESLRKQLESICTEDLIAIKYLQNEKKPSLNSIFCEHKILEAQNAFIQKRRLVPSNNSNEPREDINKTSKRFFSVTNSFKRHKTMNYEGKIEKIKKIENLDGWEILDDGLGNDKIDEFF